MLFFIASKPMMKLFIKEDNQLPQMSIDPMVLWSISTFSKIKDRITCLLFSPQCDVKKKSLQLDYVFLLCVRISMSSYFVLIQLSLCRYLTDQLQKIYVVNETNKVGLTDHTDVFEIQLDFTVDL